MAPEADLCLLHVYTGTMAYTHECLDKLLTDISVVFSFLVVRARTVISKLVLQLETRNNRF